MGWTARLAVRYPGEFCIDLFSVRYLASDCMEGWVGLCEFILYYDHPFTAFFPYYYAHIYAISVEALQLSFLSALKSADMVVH